MKYMYLALFLFVSFHVSAQLSGKLETTDHAPIPFANVLLISVVDSSLVKGTLTNDSGEYKIDGIPKGNYVLRFTAVGFTSHDSSPFTFPLSRDEHTVTTLIENTTELDEVIVRGAKPLYEQKIDRTVVNVESSIMTKGSTALQILERSPGVFIDMRTNSISMNGKLQKQ